MNVQTSTLKIGDQEIILETGKLAGQATAAVTAQMGDNIVLATVVMSSTRDDIDWFPLQVEYREKLYAGGKIKGSRWVKRDGRPSDDTILTSRLIDRSIRPLFPKGFKNEIQLLISTLSVDGENPLDILAMLASTAALSISGIPWDGPVGGVRIGQSDSGELIVNPSHEQIEASKLDLFVSATKDNILMVEAGANEVTEDVLLKGFSLAQEQITSFLNGGFAEFVKKAGKEKIEFTSPKDNQELIDLLTKKVGSKIPGIVKSKAKNDRQAEKDLLEELFEEFAETYSKKDISAVVGDLIKKEARRQTLETDIRPDGRKLDQIREISGEVSVLPRTHGSAIFNRGMTQALTIATLASPSHGQLLESAEGEETLQFFHHYNMPPFTVGEAGRVGWPSRREVGHGALAEKALRPMIPSQEEFPYTIQLVSEIMSSNGSTSQAAVCGSTMSLMDAGVPIRKPVAGIAMGLITDGNKHKVLSDIMGFEDHTGDMDFKVAGSKDGVTAMQMDVKIKGIPFEILKDALEQAKIGRLFILNKMLEVIPEPKKELSIYAPKIVTVMVPVERIGEIIGPGGKMIKSIIADSGAEVDINDEGMVFISATDSQARDKAKYMVESIIKEVEVGEEYDGKVVRLVDFGAFVEILPGKDGLVHVSNMSAEYISNPKDVVSEGDEVHVRVREVDDLGRINLTMLTPEQEAQAKQQRSQSRPNSGLRNNRDNKPRNFNRDRGPRR
jgi:polyribonucleotide nucleotidyltransferase